MRVFDDIGSLSHGAADYIATYAQYCVGARGRFTWLLSGGSTPATTYRLLAGSPYGAQGFWWKTHLYWSDERCVPPESDQSNYHLAHQALIGLIATPDAQIHRMPADEPDVDKAAERCAADLPERPDLVLLGMGADGHTASLFPESPALDERVRRVVHVEAPVEPRYRLTITPPVLHAAQRILVLVTGGNKAEALERVFAKAGDVHRTPARFAREAIWFVDRPAAERTLRLNIGGIQQVRSQ